MKWPSSITLIRHDVSVYNLLRARKDASKTYKRFLKAFEDGPGSETSRKLAVQVQDSFALRIGDASTPLEDEGANRAYTVGRALSNERDVPDVIYVSPYLRAKGTLMGLVRGWPALKKVKTYEDERIREQEHGLALIYNDWRVFHVFHPDQRELFKIEGPYWYRFPQGENVPDVRDRNRSIMGTWMREYSSKDILAVTHHLNILGQRANLERLTAEDFLRLDDNDKPINCGVTLYQGYPKEGRDGRLRLKYYNKKFY